MHDCKRNLQMHAAHEYTWKVHGNLHVLLIVLHTKVYGFHVPYHVWCMKVHVKSTWKFACALKSVVHECIWKLSYTLTRVRCGAWMYMERCMEICMHLYKCGGWMYMEISRYLNTYWTSCKGILKFPCNFSCVVHENTWEWYFELCMYL